MRYSIWAGAAALTAMGTTAASAQIVPEGKSVADRPRPDFLPIGWRMGSFFLLPTATADLNLSDNVRATATNRRSDQFARLGVDAKLVSNFPVHALSLDAFADRSIHAQAPSEDATQYGATASGRLDVDRLTTATASVLRQHVVLPRTDYNSPVGARRPVRYEQLTLDGGLKRASGDLSVEGTARYATFRFADAVDANRTTISQRYRDVNYGRIEGAVAYALTEGLGVVGRVTAERRRYTLAASDPRQPGGLDRASDGLRAEGGVKVGVEGLLYGEVRVGYFRTRYRDPAFRDPSGFSFGADMLWNPTPLTSVRVTADRRIQDAASTIVAANRVSEATLRIDHELLRNLILTAYGRYDRIVPQGPVAANDEIELRAGARYLLNRLVSIRAAYALLKRTSPDPTREFRENRGTVTVALMF